MITDDRTTSRVSARGRTPCPGAVPLPWVERRAGHLTATGWRGFEQHDLDERAALLAVAPAGGAA